MDTRRFKSNQLSKAARTSWLLAPIAGIGIFIGLYLVAALLYPGGSQANPQGIGFSWMHNYWCNLFNTEAINGQPNPARPVALPAMLILCGSLALFWYQLPALFAFSKSGSRMLQGSGILSMTLAGLIVTPYHDLFINLAGLCGLVALIYTFTGLYRQQYKGLLGSGCGCLALMGLNNYIYYTRDHLYWLPSLQKVTFAFFLSWVCLLTWQIYRTRKLLSGNKAM